MEAFDWWNSHVTSEIYLNTHRKDWWRACDMLAQELLEARSLLDVGTGDGHTLWQILSLINARGSRINDVAVIEPSEIGIERALRRLSRLALPLQRINALQGPFGQYGEGLLAELSHFDVLSSIHANYHFGKKSDGTVDVERYYFELALLPQLADKVVIMTTSGTSDYYNMIERDPFGPHAHAESVAKFYREKGFTVRVIDAPTRFFVAHALLSTDEARVLWAFFNDSSRNPSVDELINFGEKVSKFMDEEGYINFRDQIIVVS